MPCGCFGGGGKKKGIPYEPEAPPKPIKIVEEAPMVQEQQIKQNAAPLMTSQPDKNDLNDTIDSNQPSKVNGDVTTPLSNSSTVDSLGSTGARSRAELYAKRREFFKPLYDVTLTTPNSKFSVPRSASTLPARGKKGGFVIGDETGYFTTEGRFVPADGIRESAEILSSDGETVEDTSLVDNMFIDVENRVASDRPPRPISQPSAPAGEWSDIDSPQNEFHSKHHQIVQTSAHSPSVPIAPPLPKEVNPHYIEFQETHHKIVHDPESHPKDPKVTQKIVEKRLTELDKLHSEIQDNYEKRSKNGPIDVDSLVEKYTEDRWKKMVEIWESEGLVVEGGMVVVDDKGNVVQREMVPQTNGSVSSNRNSTEISESPDKVKETVTERIEQDGNKTIKIIETIKEVTHEDGSKSITKNTQTVTLEKTEMPESTVRTVITPATPQAGKTDEPSLTTGNVELEIDDYVVPDGDSSQSLVDLTTDDNLQKVQQVLEMEKKDDVEAEVTNGHDEDSTTYRVSPAGTPPPQTCTPPPSPQHYTKDLPTIVSSGEEIKSAVEVTRSTPPPSPVMET